MAFLAATGRAFLNFLEIVGRIAMIHQGKIIWSGAVEEIDRSANPYVEQFIHGRAEGPIRTEVDPAAGEDAANRGAAAV